MKLSGKDYVEEFKKHKGHGISFCEVPGEGWVLAICLTCGPPPEDPRADFDAFVIMTIDNPEDIAKIRAHGPLRKVSIVEGGQC